MRTCVSWIEGGWEASIYWGLGFSCLGCLKIRAIILGVSIRKIIAFWLFTGGCPYFVRIPYMYICIW